MCLAGSVVQTTHHQLETNNWCKALSSRYREWTYDVWGVDLCHADKQVVINARQRM